MPDRSPANAAVAVSRVTAPVRIDGVLDSLEWRAAHVIPMAYESFPGDNVPAVRSTECRITYDDSNLYFGCVASDPDPTSIRAKLQDRDRASEDDSITLIIDPFGGERIAYLFRITALGLQADALINNGAENWAWDATWASAGRITDDGYVVEAAIPFKSLRFPHTTAPQTWRFIMERSYPRSVRRVFRSIPTDRRNDCLLCQAGSLTGLEGIQPGRNIELAPTMTSTRTDRRAAMPAGELATGRTQWDAGLTTHWGITPSLTASMALNPDFSQVEADAAQLDVNTRFALSVPERRPFFLEGLQHFQTFLPLVFTRSVIDPVGGVKLTGREGSNSIGVFATHDRVNRLLFASNQQSRSTVLDSEVSTGVFRFEREVGRASTLAVAYTGRAGDEYENHAGSVDGFLRLSPSNAIRFQAAATRTRYPDEVAQQFQQPQGSFNGHAAIVQFSHASRDWNGYFHVQDIPAGFRADAGFFPRSDVRVARGTMQRVFTGGPDRWYTRLAFGAFAQHLMFREGGTTDQGVQLNASYTGARQTVINGAAGRRRELFGGRMYALDDLSASFQIRPNGQLLFRVSGQFGEQIDFANQRKGRVFQVSPAADLWLGRSTNLTLDHTRQRLSAEGAEIFTLDQLQARAMYHLNTRTFVRGLAQYRRLDRNVDMFVRPVAPTESRLLSQLLFSYKLNPQTVLFLGYSDTAIGREEYDLTRQDRTFFMKLGYAWRL